MTIEAEDIVDLLKDAQEYIALIPVLQPVINSVLENLKIYSDDYETVRKFVVSSIVKTKADIYKGLISEGIPAEHALALTVGSLEQLKSAIKSAK